MKPDAGYAFIAVDGGADVFAHVRNFDASIEFTEQLRGRRLVFDVVEDARRGKPHAVNVRALA